MNPASALFCAASIGCFVLLSFVLFPLAARTPQQLQYSVTAQEAELFDDVDLGEFGAVPVLDMMLHYVEDPPVEGSAAPELRFQGC